MEAHRGRSASGRSTGREVEEWKMARDWLHKIGILLPSKAVDASSTLFDFAQSLRDGVLLCQLANVLEPGAVKDINTKSQMSQFMCLKNIRSFLTACTRHFHISNDDLFEDIGLYDVSDFAKVVHTLSKLSSTPQALMKGVEPFAPSVGHNSVEIYEEDDIYSNLEEIAMNRDITDEENPYDSINVEEEDKIYEDLVSIQIPKPTRQSSQEEKRNYVVSELLETERGYVDALRMILETFIQNSKLKSFLHSTDKDITDIFDNIETGFTLYLMDDTDYAYSDFARVFRVLGAMDLYSVHRKFLTKLERACNNSDNGTKIGKVFIDAKDDFLKYGNYCARMPDAQTQIDELSRREAKVKNTLEECQRNAKSKFSLRSLLVVPFQRVLKYPLLLQHLLKETKGNHPDKTMLEKAQECIQDVATYINQVKRDDENLKTVRDVQSSLTSEVGEDLGKFGRLMKDGEVQVKIGDRPPKKRHAFLFDRALIICKHKGDTYHHKATLFLDYFDLQENFTFGPGRGKFLHGWSMKGETPESERNSCSLYAKTADMKDKWVNEIKRAMDNLKLPGIDQKKHRFDLYSFGNAMYCSICQKLLWGLIHQGYKCSRCDTACHKDCISKCNPCRKNTQDKKFSGVSPFQPRQNMGKGTITGTLSPENQRRPRKISAPPRIGPDFSSKPVPLVKQISTPTPSTDWLHSRSIKPVPRAHKSNEMVVAISNFQGMAPSGRPSLNLVVGDEVEVLNQSDPEWWEGRSSRTGSVGYFLRSHVTENDESTSLKRNKSSNRSYKYEEHTLLEETPENPSTAPDDINRELWHYPWFVGKMDRATAERELSQRSDGTFLVRESVNREGEYALSVKFRVSTKHIKIPYDGYFCLTQIKTFNSITDLVQYYRDNTLGVSFPGLDTTLRCGINEELAQEGIGWAKALYPYNARNAKEISIKKNSKILILNKDGDWWKGECDGQVGYFPSNYIEELKD